MKKLIKWAGLGLLALFAAIQLIPYGRAHDNPPVTAEAPWPDGEVRALAARACFDCHSNETRWPWYSHVAPASWLVQYDVDQGRSKVDFSEWDRPQHDADEAVEALTKGEMPPFIYRVMHPDAALTPAERRRLASGLGFTGAAERHGEEHEALDVN